MTRTAPTRELRLHLGAHRTATTSLQAALDAASPLLARHGCRANTPWRIGARDAPSLRAVTRLVARAARPPGLRRQLRLWTARAAMRDHVSWGEEVTVLSDENFIGNPFGVDGTFYPSVRRRLAALRAVVPVMPSRIHVAVRDYATFAVSAYAMVALYGARVPSFEAVRDALLSSGGAGWVGVLEAIAEAFPDADVTTSRFEAAAVAAPLSVLLPDGLSPSDLPAPPRRVNAAPTREAVAAALAVRERGGRPDADALIAAHADGAPFAPLDAEAAGRLSERYRADVSRLGARFADVGACGAR